MDRLRKKLGAVAVVKIAPGGEAVLRLWVGADHGGVELKQVLVAWLQAHHPGLSVNDVGTFDTRPVDYPDIARQVAAAVAKDPSSAGILICGTGNGMAMTANKVRGIRAAVVFNEFTGKMAKAHNHANVICLGGRSTPQTDALAALKAWLEAAAEGERHQRRVEKIGQ